MTAMMMAITSLNLLAGVSDDRLLTEDDLPYEVPLGVGHSTTMLLGIFTNASEHGRIARERIRDTYLKEVGRDPRVCKLSEYINQHVSSEGTNVVCQIPYVFVVGGDPERDTDHGDDTRLVIDNAKEPLVDDVFDDTVYLNIKENDNEGKSASYFKWAHTLTDQYKIDYVAKAPTSTLIDIQLMLKSLSLDLAPAPYNRRIYGGDTWGDYKTNIVYAHGAFYFLSSDLAAFVGSYLQASDRDNLSMKEDEAKDIGVFVYTHPKPIKFLFLSQNIFWYPALNTTGGWYDAWEKMSDLPTRSPLVPLHGICAQMKRNGDFVSEKR
jgi:hypothetical protein